ncbi:hypothetical protein BC828DRAFT_390964 [Blastocladiella britannica]|nr:hypothetical protein BC828DRAFT_390964 [Blastocladiella britannica]
MSFRRHATRGMTCHDRLSRQHQDQQDWLPVLLLLPFFLGLAFGPFIYHSALALLEPLLPVYYFFKSLYLILTFIYFILCFLLPLLDNGFVSSCIAFSLVFLFVSNLNR